MQSSQKVAREHAHRYARTHTATLGTELLISKAKCEKAPVHVFSAQPGLEVANALRPRPMPPLLKRTKCGAMQCVVNDGEYIQYVRMASAHRSSPIINCLVAMGKQKTLKRRECTVCSVEHKGLTHPDLRTRLRIVRGQTIEEGLRCRLPWPASQPVRVSHGPMPQQLACILAPCHVLIIDGVLIFDIGMNEDS
jgi:hypothetical protein